MTKVVKSFQNLAKIKKISQGWLWARDRMVASEERRGVAKRGAPWEGCRWWSCPGWRWDDDRTQVGRQQPSRHQGSHRLTRSLSMRGSRTTHLQVKTLQVRWFSDYFFILSFVKKKHNIWSLFHPAFTRMVPLGLDLSGVPHSTRWQSLQIARLPDCQIAKLPNCSTKTYYTAQASERAPNRLWEVATRELTTSPLEVEIQVAYWYGEFRRSGIV